MAMSHLLPVTKLSPNWGHGNHFAIPVWNSAKQIANLEPFEVGDGHLLDLLVEMGAIRAA